MVAVVDLTGVKACQGEVLLRALDQAVDAVVIVDARNEVTFFNEAAERMWQRRRDEVLGRNLAGLVPVDERPALERLAAAADPDHGPAVEASREITIRRPDATSLCGLWSLSRIVVGDEIHRLVMIKDVTEEVKRREQMRLLSLVADGTDAVVLITDGDRKVVYVNRAFTDLFGYELEEMLGRTPTDVLAGKHTSARSLMRLRRQAWQYEGFHEEILAYSKSGREIWVSAQINPIKDDGGRIKNVVALIENITDSKHIQDLQRVTLEDLANDLLLPEIADHLCRRVELIAPDVVVSILLVTPEKTLQTLAGPSLPESYSSQIDGVPIGPKHGSCGTAAYRGQPVTVVDIETDPLWADFRHLILPLGFRACWSSPIKRKDGTVVGTFALYFRTKRAPSSWHEHIVNACVHLCALAINRHEAKAHIAHLAYYDALTGLPNRALLHQDITRRLEEEPDSQIAFMFLDLDHFKDVNDTLGHSVGDRLLVEIATRLRASVRPGDVVSRLGGDEFVLMLPDCTIERARLAAQRLCDILSTPVDIDGIQLPVSASIGISLAPDNGATAETLLKNADTAMYEAKAAGRGTFRFFSQEMNRYAQERLILGSALRDALANGLLRLAYQPQVCARTGALHGVEALARWTDPDLGEIAPSRFIALATESGLIDAIGVWAMEAACRQMADWRQRGVAIPTVSVNLSPLHFRDPDLPSVVSRLLDRYGLPPEALTIEITEGVMAGDTPETMETVEALSQLGIRLSMDDFGSGYSSLGNLAKLPISELKIDRSFMHHFETDLNAQAVAVAVIRIGQALGMTVVAEGVETQAQLILLSEMECDVVQGFLYAQAMRPEELEAWLARRKPTEFIEAVA